MPEIINLDGEKVSFNTAMQEGDSHGQMVSLFLSLWQGRILWQEKVAMRTSYFLVARR